MVCWFFFWWCRADLGSFLLVSRFFFLCRLFGFDSFSGEVSSHLALIFAHTAGDTSLFRSGASHFFCVVLLFLLSWSCVALAFA